MAASAALALAPGANAQFNGPAHDTVAFSCQTVTFSYEGFPQANGNTVTEIVYVDGAPYITRTFSFDGPSGSDAVTLDLPPGHHKLDARAKWKTNGVKGGHDQPDFGGVRCGAEPSFTVEKLQRGTPRSPFTTSTVFGARRQTIDYEIVVKNTGNVPLVLSGFSDPRCDAGTVAGGPGSTALAPGEASTYTCTHRLTPEDQALGTYENTATVTATPPSGDGAPLSEPSNPVLVDLPHDTATPTCSEITFTFAGFPDLPGNTVSEFVRVDRELVVSTSYTFDGPTGSNSIALALPPGHHSIDAWARWHTNGASGGHDEHIEGGILCEAPPE